MSGWLEQNNLRGVGLWTASIVIVLGMLSYALLDRTEAGQQLLARMGGNPTTTLPERDRALGRDVQRFLGHDDEADREIDLRFPTDADVAFLIRTLNDGSRDARISAARALVVIQDERGIQPLLLATGAVGRDGEEKAFACSAALDIVRFQTRERAAALLIDAQEDKQHPIDGDCQSAIAEKLTWIHAESQEVLAALVQSELPRVQRYALDRLQATEKPELLQAIAELTVGPNPDVAAQARSWLDRQGLMVVPEEPGPGSEPNTGVTPPSIPPAPGANP